MNCIRILVIFYFNHCVIDWRRTEKQEHFDKYLILDSSLTGGGCCNYNFLISIVTLDIIDIYTYQMNQSGCVYFLLQRHFFFSHNQVVFNSGTAIIVFIVYLFFFFWVTQSAVPTYRLCVFFNRNDIGRVYPRRGTVLKMHLSTHVFIIAH